MVAEIDSDGSGTVDFDGKLSNNSKKFRKLHVYTQKKTPNHFKYSTTTIQHLSFVRS